MITKLPEMVLEMKPEKLLKGFKLIFHLSKELLLDFAKCADNKNSKELTFIIRLIEVVSYSWFDLANIIFKVIKDWAPIKSKFQLVNAKFRKMECRIGGEILG
jgi:hypothetical protein